MFGFPKISFNFIKGLYFGKDRNFWGLIPGLEDKGFKVSRDSDTLVLRPRFEKFMSFRAFFMFAGYYAYIKKIVLSLDNGYIFLKVKFNFFMYFTGLLFLIIHIKWVIDLDFKTMIDSIIIFFLLFSFLMYFVSTLLIKSDVKKEIKKLMK